MKAPILFCLSLITGGFGWTSKADAAPLSTATHNPGICRNYNAAEAFDIDYLASAVRNLNASPRFVICPLVVVVPESLLETDPEFLIDVTIEGSTIASQKLTCTLISYNSAGYYSGSSSNTLSGGWFMFSLEVSGNSGVDASVLCVLPGSAGGQVTQLSSNVRIN